MLWALNFKKAKDANGRDIPVDINAVTQGIVCRPQPFACVIEPRSGRRAEMAKKSWESAKEMLMKYPDGITSTQYADDI